MQHEPVLTWVLWWAHRGKQHSCATSYPVESRHFGLFLRESEIQWRKARVAIERECTAEIEAFRERARHLATQLGSWWEDVTSSFLADFERNLAGFIAEPRGNLTPDVVAMQDVLKRFAARPDWKDPKRWESARKWMATVGDSIRAFANTSGEKPPTELLPFDLRSMPTGEPQLRFVRSVMYGAIGANESTQSAASPASKAPLSAQLAALADELDDDGFATFAVAVSATLWALITHKRLPRAFDEYCMDLAASRVSAFRTLDALFNPVSREGILRAAAWAQFRAWDSLSTGINMVQVGSGCAALKELEDSEGLRGWIAHGGLPSSFEAFNVALVITSASNALAGHLAFNGAFGPADVAPQHPEPSSVKARPPVVDVFKEPKGKRLKHKVSVEGATQSVPPRYAKFLEDVAKTGEVTADHRTYNKLMDFFPELQAFIKPKPEKKIQNRKGIYQAPDLINRVDVHVPKA